MKKWVRVLYCLSLGASAIYAAASFFFPLIFKWYDLLPSGHPSLIAGVDYATYTLSFLLLGYSVLMILSGKKALAKKKTPVYFYYLLSTAWLLRAILASFVERWPLQPSVAAALIQFLSNDLIAIAMMVVSAMFYLEMKKDSDPDEEDE